MKTDSKIIISNISFYGNLIMASVVDTVWISVVFIAMAIFSLIRGIYLDVKR